MYIYCVNTTFCVRSPKELEALETSTSMEKSEKVFIIFLKKFIKWPSDKIYCKKLFQNFLEPFWLKKWE